MNAKAEVQRTLAVRDAMHGPFRCQDAACCVPICKDCDARLKPVVEEGEWRCKACGYADLWSGLPAPTEADETRYWDERRAP